MDSFKNLLRIIGVYHEGIDYLKELPLEISEIILSKLDDESLFNTAQVSTKWYQICQSFSKYRKKIHSYIVKRNRRLSQVLPSTIYAKSKSQKFIEVIRSAPKLNVQSYKSFPQLELQNLKYSLTYNKNLVSKPMKKGRKLRI